ncbi:MAG TPA: hypothetical protein PLY32_04315 [Salinivirgaceae bacterium]|nr:hypothetical protein [Salinivirgaceae bacterium]
MELADDIKELQHLVKALLSEITSLKFELAMLKTENSELIPIGQLL